MLSSITSRTAALTRSSISHLSHASSSVASATFLTPVRMMSTKGGGREVRMRVLLKEDSRLGLKGDEVVVKRGYGRNVLVGKGRAVYATEENKRIFAERAAREKAEKAAAAGAEAAAAAADSATAADSADAAAAPVASSVGSDEESFRFTLELTRRLASLRPMVFLRETQGRDQSIKHPITPMDVYQRLVKQFPSIVRSQIKFLSDSQALGKVGEVTAEISGFGTFKPVTFKVQLKRSVKGQLAVAASTKEATPAATATTVASAASKAKAASIRA